MRLPQTAAESAWGRVLSWSPPAGFSMTWHPGRPADPHTVVEISFAAEGDSTRVRLVHRGWEALGATALAARDSYDGGWQSVFVRDFGAHAGRG